MSNLVGRLRQYDLSKTEIYSIINLGIGLPRLQSAATNGDADTMDADGANGSNEEDTTTEDTNQDQPVAIEEIDEADEATARHILALVIDSLDNRFTGDEGDEKIEGIIKAVRDSVKLSSNGTTHGDGVELA